jgi:DNA-binding PadR family transcriptional regulator
MTKPPTNLGELAFQILLALGEGPAHGYAIGKEVQQRSNGRLDPTTGALYQALKRLTDEGLIAPVRRPPEPSPDARRKYFQLTAAGRRAAALEAERLAALVAAAQEKKLYAAPARTGS